MIFNTKREAYLHRIEMMTDLIIKRNQELFNKNGGYKQASEALDNYSFSFSVDGVESSLNHFSERFEQLMFAFGKLDYQEIQELDKSMLETFHSLDILAIIPELPTLVDMKNNDDLEQLYYMLDNGDWDTDTMATQLHPTEMFNMDFDRRIQLIQHISDGWWVGNEDEDSIVNLLSTVPQTDQKKLYNKFKNENFEFLTHLHGKLGDKQNADLHAIIRNNYINDLGMATLAELATKDNIKTFPWADPGLISMFWDDRFSYDVKFENGFVEVSYSADLTLLEKGGVIAAANAIVPGPIGTASGLVLAQNLQKDVPGELIQPGEKLKLDPYELIKVKFFHDEDHVGKIEDETYLMPAINLLTLKHSQFWNDAGKLFDVGMLALGVATGVGAISAGSKILKAIAIADIVFAVGDTIVKEFRSKLVEYPLGRAFLTLWDVASTAFAIFGIGQLVVEGAQLITKLASKWKNVPKVAKEALGSNADLIDNHIKILTGIAEDASTNPDLKKALEHIHDAKVNDNLENLDNLIKNDLGEQAYDSLKPQLSQYVDELDGLAKLGFADNLRVKNEFIEAFIKKHELIDSAKIDEIKDIIQNMDNYPKISTDYILELDPDQLIHLKNNRPANFDDIDDLLKADIDVRGLDDDLLPKLPEQYTYFETNSGKLKIRRKSGFGSDDNLVARLTIDDNGKIVRFTGAVSNRISKPGELRRILLAELGLDKLDGFQAHHIVPDAVVRDSPLFQLAVKYDLYNIDSATNGRMLAQSLERQREVIKNLTPDQLAKLGIDDIDNINVPVHNGSHGIYNELAMDTAREIYDDLIDNFPELMGSIDQIEMTPELSDAIKTAAMDVEESMSDILNEWVKKNGEFLSIKEN